MKKQPVNDYKKTLGEKIRSKRETLNISRNKLADSIGVSLSTLQAWEAGEREPSATDIILISQMLDTTVAWLFNEDLTEQPINSTINIGEMSKSQILLQKWIDIFNIMGDINQEIAINNIIENGFKPLLIDVNKEMKLSKIKQTIFNLLLELNEEDAKEILSNIGNRRSAHRPEQKQA